MKKQSKVVLIGAGKLGFNLGTTLLDNNIELVQVFSRQLHKAQKIAQQSPNCIAINQLTEVDPTADLYILAIKDDAIALVAHQLKEVIPAQSLVVHTSGATSMEAIQLSFTRSGVFYPFQSFSIEKKADFTQIPLCITTAQQEDMQLLTSIGQQIHSPIYQLTDEQRGQLHVAAVFANNFTNHLYYIAHQLLQEKELPLDLIRPLILETAKKVQNFDPLTMQTGPAVRNDHQTIQKHLIQLTSNQMYQDLYRLITKNIIKSHNT